jgi:SAM-dependent methyltransferase
LDQKKINSQQAKSSRLLAENKLKEQDIRPKEVFDEFLRLAEEDAKKFFPNSQRTNCNCPGCGSSENELKFEKKGFNYCSCNHCDSLFVNPRPTKQAFDRFYKDGASTRYFANTFLPSVLESRRHAIFTPRVEQVYKIAANENIIPEVIVEIGAGHGIFLEEWAKVHPNSDRRAVEPNPIMAQYCRDIGIKVLETTSEDAKEWLGIADIGVSFEVLEHVTDPLAFVCSLLKFIRPGGLLIATGLCGDGFDIRVLGKRSKSITPPHHINFCSIEGYEQLFSRAGFEKIKIQTPGKLDVEIVHNALKDNSIELSDFENLLLRKKPKHLDNFQKFLSKNQLSSHCWIAAQRPIK